MLAFAKLLAPVILLAFISAPGLSQEMAEIKKKIAAMKKEAAALIEIGHIDEASQLKRKAQELMDQATSTNQTKGSKTEGEPRKERILAEPQPKKLKKPAPITPELDHPAFHEMERAGQRLKHIRAAIENLKAAEMHDMARELSHRAEGMEREIQQAKVRLAEMHKDALSAKHPKGDSIVDKLREANERLQLENQELRKKLESLDR